MNRSDSIVKLAVALAKFNGEVSSISKDAKNPFFKSDYVTLDKLILATREILHKNGLSVLQMPLSKDTGEIGIQTILMHESGEYIESDPLFMKPVKNDPQQAGSLITYLRRYSYQAILNLNTGQDDDANIVTFTEPPATKGEFKSYNDSELITENQRKRLFAISKGKDSDEIIKILNKYNFKKSEEITKGKYNNICDEIEAL